MLPLQYRDFSSVSEKAVSKIYGYFFKTVFGGAGILLARVTTSPFSSGLQEIEDDVKEAVCRQRINNKKV
ncbi:BnaC01g40710D [Brassica napus]|uniref:BnaC01g40710D protein n=1 Tax=Brassica napus TaxID=3708 RepID=A0A078JH95_BRANA|nr:BnaC01g40710D [Brassica napus]